jgi:hypothetical protein
MTPEDGVEKMSDETMSLLREVYNFSFKAKEYILKLPSAKTVQELPVDSGVYFIVDNKDTIIYIGQSSCIRYRFRNRQDFRLTGDGWIRVHYLANSNNMFSIDQTEALFIALLAPTYNRRLSSGANSRYSWDWLNRVFAI